MIKRTTRNLKQQEVDTTRNRPRIKLNVWRNEKRFIYLTSI